MRSFDPRKVGGLECDAWVTYYRREWVGFLRAAVSLTRHTFSLPWPATLYGASTPSSPGGTGSGST
jgi:hypothetical protein